MATISAIEQCGGIPILVDIDPATYTLNPQLLENAITSKTRAVIPVHLYGHLAEMRSILEIAKRHKIFVLEDCAQAHGSLYLDKKVGAFGHVAAFSFYPTKNLGGIGDGGMIVTNDERLSHKIRKLREYGWKKRFISDISGFNSRLDEIQSAVLRVKLKYLDFNNNRRRENARNYSSLLAHKINTSFERHGCKHVYHLYVIRHKHRDTLREFLHKNGTSDLTV